MFGKNVALFIFNPILIEIMINFTPFKNYDNILMDLNCYQHGCVLSCLSIDLFY